MVELDLVKRINEFLSDYDNVESEALNYIEYND